MKEFIRTENEGMPRVRGRREGWSRIGDKLLDVVCGEGERQRALRMEDGDSRLRLSMSLQFMLVVAPAEFSQSPRLSSSRL